MSNTTKKHQPNGKSLIHNFCNGITKEMVCGNLTSGNGSLFSYSLRLAETKIINNRHVFAVVADGYRVSVTTNKHTNWFIHSIPLLANTRMFTGNHDGTAGSIISETQRLHGEAWKDKQYRWIFHTGRTPCFDATGYRYMTGQIIGILSAMKNPRVSRFGNVDIIRLVWEIESCKRYRELFCKGEKAVSLGNWKTIVSRYLERIAKREQNKIIRQKQEKEILQRKIAVWKDKLDILNADWNRHIQALMSGWREHKGQEYHNGSPLWTETQRITRELDDIADALKINRWKLRTEYEEMTGRTFHSKGDKVMLRIASSGEEIETSRGAFLPLGIGRIMWSRHKGLVERVLAGESDISEGFPIPCGHYTWAGVRNGNLVIGCHSIPASEIKTLAEKEGW